MNASRTPVASASAEEAYRRFREKSAPLWVWLAISNPLPVILLFGTVYAIFKIIPFSNLPFDPYDFGYNWGVTALIAVFVYRGRRHLRTMLVGTLRPWQVGGVAVVAAAAGMIWEYAFLRIAGLPGPTFPHAWQSDDELYLIVWAPLREEFVFQASLQTALQRFGPAVAVVATTIVFSLYHFGTHEIVMGTSFEAIKSAILQRFGPLLAFAIVRQTTKSLGAAILSHALVNLTALATLT